MWYLSSTQTLLPSRFNIPFDHFPIMNPSSEQQARQLRGKIEAFDAAVRAAVGDGTIIILMGKRGKEMVSATSNMLISSC